VVVVVKAKGIGVSSSGGSSSSNGSSSRWCIWSVGRRRRRRRMMTDSLEERGVGWCWMGGMWKRMDGNQSLYYQEGQPLWLLRMTCDYSFHQ